MTLLTKILTPFIEVKKWLFGKPAEVVPKGWESWSWVNDKFFTDERHRTAKLAEIARWIEGATVVVAKRKAQKKRHSHVLAAIKAAQTERLMIETGRMVYDPAFGAWVVKGEK